MKLVTSNPRNNFYLCYYYPFNKQYIAVTLSQSGMNASFVNLEPFYIKTKAFFNVFLSRIFMTQ